MNQLSNFISQYLKTCETIKKLDSKTLKAYRIDLSLQILLERYVYSEIVGTFILI